MLEENETQETSLQDLIDLVERDDLPTNEFTTQDTDPMVLLGKLNEVIAYLEQLQATINSSDTKANEALQKAIQAIADATQALSVANGIDDKATQALANAVEAVSTANTALSASNTALSTANTAISTANTALSSANSAVETAESAETKADTAITTANGAKTTAEGIDSKATTALSNSQTAITTANNADSKADSANTTANEANTKADNAVSVANSANTTANEANTKADNAVSTANSASTTASTASQNASTALTTAQTANQNASTALTTANNADSKADSAVATAEDALNQVVAGLGTKVYRDTTLLSNLDIKPIENDIASHTTAITALQNGKVDKVAGKQLSTEDFTTNEKNKLAGLNNYDDTQIQADITALQNGKIDWSAIQQTTGTGTNVIMSQNATTVELNKKVNADASNLTNISSWQTKLNNLVRVAGEVNYGQAVVVETGGANDGSYGYRIWSDGWKECWGSITSSTTNSTFTSIALPIDFSNTNFAVTSSVYNSSRQVAIRVRIDSVSSIAVSAGVQGTGYYSSTIRYYACGY